MVMFVRGGTDEDSDSLMCEEVLCRVWVGKERSVE